MLISENLLSLGGEIGFQPLETVTDGSVPHIASNPDSQSAQKFRSHDEFGSQLGAVFSLQTGDDLRSNFAGQFAGALNAGMAFFHFQPDQTLVILQNREGISGLLVH